uniref:Tnp_zf-ribbon_2 domain-containing protein n=1 Tax=Loa loa TaxID=7209 RepID=A0A1I7VTH8_LOALO
VDNFVQFEEAQTEQTDLLDLPVQKVSEERNVSIGLPMQGVSGEVGIKEEILVDEVSERHVTNSKRKKSQRICEICGKIFCPIRRYEDPYEDSYWRKTVHL